MSQTDVLGAPGQRPADFQARGFLWLGRRALGQAPGRRWLEALSMHFANAGGNHGRQWPGQIPSVSTFDPTINYNFSGDRTVVPQSIEVGQRSRGYWLLGIPQRSYARFGQTAPVF